jgi:RNA polymerase sigma factor (sigma-70 family)
MMDETEWLAERFEQHRPRLRAVAYRMLGSLTEADDAVQDAWIRLSRSNAEQIYNLGGWLTTVVARECLHMLRSRRRRREVSFEGRLPDPVITPDGDLDPEQEALLADSVGLALLVMLERLTPAERLAFVLHDMFELPFDEIAPIVGRSPAAARQLASRARRRVRGEATLPATDTSRQREAVDAFLAASRDGDLGALLAVLDPDVVLRADPGAAGTSREVRGAHAVAEQARAFSHLGRFSRRALVNGVAGIVSRAPGGPTFSVMGFAVASGKITEIDILADPERLRLLDLTFLDD